MSPYLRQHQIGDIIAFNHEGKGWVSRIVALEDDTVQIAEGEVIVAIDKPLQVPPAHVFVLSDNLSAQHDDSRIFGPIAKDAIIGVVW